MKFKLAIGAYDDIVQSTVYCEQWSDVVGLCQILEYGQGVLHEGGKTRVFVDISHAASGESIVLLDHRNWTLPANA